MSRHMLQPGSIGLFRLCHCPLLCVLAEPMRYPTSRQLSPAEHGADHWNADANTTQDQAQSTVLDAHPEASMLAVGLQAQMNTSLVCPSSVVTWLAAICSPVVAPLMSGRAVSVPFAAAPLRIVCP